MREHVAGALLGACLLAIPPVVGPDVDHRAVELTAAAEIIDLTSPVSTRVTIAVAERDTRTEVRR